MPAVNLKDWLKSTNPVPGIDKLVVLTERKGERAAVQTAIEDMVRDHFASLDILNRIGKYRIALEFIRNKLPPGKRTRSGDFGEVLASEYIDQLTEYRLPIKKLRWKDDRATPMRGNDVIAIRRARNKSWRVLKGESKSRATLTPSVVTEAMGGLDQHAGRPNPSSLAFIAHRLRELDRDDEAEVFEDLQSRTPKIDEVEQMVFTLSGNDPTSHLRTAHASGATFVRYFVGCVISDHQSFIQTLFDNVHAGKRR